MTNFDQVLRILSVKRDRAEQGVAACQAEIDALNTKIAALRQSIDFTSAQVYDPSLNPDHKVADALTFMRWTNHTHKTILNYQTRIRTVREEKLAHQSTLKSLIVKYDMIENQAKSTKAAAFQADMDQQSEDRLETWVMSNRM